MKRLPAILAGSAIAFIAVPVAAQPRPTAALAVVGGTIYTDPISAPVRNGVILIEDGKIAGVGRRGSVQVPRGVHIINCAGLTITAGFWNSHVHFIERKWGDAATLPASELAEQLQSMLTKWGFTSVFDTWFLWDNTRTIRDRIESG